LVNNETHNVHNTYKQIEDYNLLDTRNLDDLNRRLRDKVEEYNSEIATNKYEIDNGLYGLNRVVILETLVNRGLKDQDIRELYDAIMPPKRDWNRRPYFKKHRADNLYHADGTS
jgi:hypothetical protein